MTVNNIQGTDSNLSSFQDVYTYVYVLGLLGFASFLCLVLVGISSPILPLLSYATIFDSFLLRAISIFTLLLAYIFCSWKSDLFVYHSKRFLCVGSLLLLPALISGLAGHTFGCVPLPVTVLCWGAFGIGQGVLALFWMTFFSAIPSKRTALSITLGGCVGTLVFSGIALQGSALICIIEIAFVCITNLALGYFLSQHIQQDTSQFLDSEDSSLIAALPVSFSVGAQGLVYGFTVVFLCSLGIIPLIIGITFGLIGELVASLWAVLRPKTGLDIDQGLSQRITLPVIVTGIILIPLVDNTGEIICGGLVIAALAHSVMTLWSKAAVDNHEFQLQPIKHFSHRQIADWAGFLLGTLLAFVLFFVVGATREQLLIASAAQVIIVVLAFSAYGADEQKRRRYLNELMTTNQDLNEEIKPPNESNPRHALFRERCESIIISGGLTKREAEVFRMLAKGRNAEFIQKELYVSASTAKTHIYNIYKKLDINSQQRLIDIIDNHPTE